MPEQISYQAEFILEIIIKHIIIKLGLSRKLYKMQIKIGNAFGVIYFPHLNDVTNKGKILILAEIIPPYLCLAEANSHF